jgi:hypothetical protein
MVTLFWLDTPAWAPTFQHPYVKDEVPESDNFGYCATCGMEKYAQDWNSVHVHSNTGLPSRPRIDLSDWQTWRDANMPGGE